MKLVSATKLNAPISKITNNNKEIIITHSVVVSLDNGQQISACANIDMWGGFEVFGFVGKFPSSKKVHHAVVRTNNECEDKTRLWAKTPGVKSIKNKPTYSFAPETFWEIYF